VHLRISPAVEVELFDVLSYVVSPSSTSAIGMGTGAG